MQVKGKVPSKPFVKYYSCEEDKHYPQQKKLEM